MSKCEHERRYRECFLVNHEMGIKRWLPHASSVLGREVTIPEWGETFFVKSMSADYLSSPPAEPEKLYQQVEMVSGDADALAWIDEALAVVGTTVHAAGMEWIIIETTGLSATAEQLLRMPQDARLSTSIN